jgi:hypothetical protein
MVQEIRQGEATVTEQARRRQFDIRPTAEVHLTLSQPERGRIAGQAVPLDERRLDQWVATYTHEPPIAVVGGKRLEQVLDDPAGHGDQTVPAT